MSRIGLEVYICMCILVIYISICVRCSGKCVCEMCSREKIRIERIDTNKLFKVCLTCARDLKSSRRYGVQAYTESDD